MDHHITVPAETTKTEVLVLAFDYPLRKRYVVDEVARQYNVKISWFFVLFQSIFYVDKRIFMAYR
jgi:hypothetical protein